MKYTRRRVYRKKRPTTLTKGKTFAKRVRRIANQALKNKVEVKRWTSGTMETSVNTLTQGTNWIQFAQPITQGTGSYNRVGDKIKVIGIQVKGYIYNGTAVPIWMRHAMLKSADKGALSTGSAIFMGTASNQETDFTTETGMKCILRPFHPTAITKVYRDKVVKLAPNDSTAGGQNFRRFSFFQKFGRGLTVRFNSASTGTANTEPNVQWGMWCAEAPEDVSTGVNLEVSFQYTVFYTDA